MIAKSTEEKCGPAKKWYGRNPDPEKEQV